MQRVPSRTFRPAPAWTKCVSAKDRQLPETGARLFPNQPRQPAAAEAGRHRVLRGYRPGSSHAQVHPTRIQFKLTCTIAQVRNLPRSSARVPIRSLARNALGVLWEDAVVLWENA